MSYDEELSSAMTWLGQQSDTLFVGQSVAYPGNALYGTLEGVPISKRLELPIMEDCQLGMSIGMAMMGKVVISIYPRMDFLLLALNQLVNHLDKGLYPMSGKVIIRTCVGSTSPLHPGVQHCGDYTDGIEKMLTRVGITKLLDPLNVMPAYLGAYASRWPSILVELGDMYGS